MSNRLGKYKINEKLGEGATAEVYRAVDTSLEREVALKLLKPALVADPYTFERFRQEARAAAVLFHPNIATVFEIGEEEGRYFIAMRFIEGRSLNQVLQEDRPMPWDEVLHMATQLGEALDYAHSEGFLHRDVKPSNIIQSKSKDYVLTDFGLVRAMMNTGITTHTGALLGTPAYIAPEIWNGEEASSASDQYALACVLYESITGETLFGGTNPQEIITKHLIKELEFPEKWPEGTPAGLRDALTRAISRESQERYENIKGMASVLAILETPAQKNARLQDEEKAKREAEEAARRETKRINQHQAEQAAKREKMAQAQREAEQAKKRETEEKARLKREAEEQTRKQTKEQAHSESEKGEIKEVRPPNHRTGKISHLLNLISIIMITFIWSLAWLVNEIIWDKGLKPYGASGATIIWAIGGALAGVVIGICLRKYPPYFTSLRTVLWIALGWAIGPAIGIQITWNTSEPVAFWGGGLITFGLITGLVLRKDNPILKRKSTIKMIIGWIFGWAIGYALYTLFGDISFRRAIAGATIGIIGSGVMFWQLKSTQEQ